ncbi:unnamed protein product [Echinostoma caproni]|uniref:Secreted protein n=1 Tax=Echinostoma caproni TaxID=27848 RepID=A0A183AS83_9TREM|nr:unnamed protein product [Echinostoma caproni]
MHTYSVVLLVLFSIGTIDICPGGDTSGSRTGAGIRSGTYGLSGDDPEESDEEDDDGDREDATDSRTSEAPKRILIRKPPGVLDGTGPEEAGGPAFETEDTGLTVVFDGVELDRLDYEMHVNKVSNRFPCDVML